MHMPFPQRKLEQFRLPKVTINFKEENTDFFQRKIYTSRIENTLFFIFNPLRSF